MIHRDFNAMIKVKANSYSHVANSLIIYIIVVLREGQDDLVLEIIMILLKGKGFASALILLSGCFRNLLSCKRFVCFLQLIPNPVYLFQGIVLRRGAKGTGMKSIELALSMCDIVDIYGFTVDPGYTEW